MVSRMHSSVLLAALQARHQQHLTWWLHFQIAHSLGQLSCWSSHGAAWHGLPLDRILSFLCSRTQDQGSSCGCRFARDRPLHATIQLLMLACPIMDLMMTGCDTFPSFNRQCLCLSWHSQVRRVKPASGVMVGVSRLSEPEKTSAIAAVSPLTSHAPGLVHLGACDYRDLNGPDGR